MHNALKPTGDIERHPLAKIVPLSKPSPPNWVINGFIAEGVVLIAGGHGVGKTTAILPLAMAAAGLHLKDYELAPTHWRHVIYITEDVQQAKRIIAGYSGAIGKSHNAIEQRFHLVEALRMPVDKVVGVAADYTSQYMRSVKLKNGVTAEMPPLVVMDTLAAIFDLENENDNAEASRMVAAIKQQFASLPVWIVSHVSKGNLTKDGAKSGAPTSRGASAFEADANQVLYLVKENPDALNSKRWIVRGKTRFEAEWPELEICSGIKYMDVANQFGEIERLVLMWGVAQPPKQTREDAAQAVKEEQEKAAQEAFKSAVVNELNRAWISGHPLNRTALYGHLSGNRQRNQNQLNALIDEGAVIEVLVPRAMRSHHTKEKYLVALNDDEMNLLVEHGKVPRSKIMVPSSWLSESANADDEVIGEPISPHYKKDKKCRSVPEPLNAENGDELTASGEK